MDGNDKRVDRRCGGAFAKKNGSLHGAGSRRKGRKADGMTRRSARREVRQSLLGTDARAFAIAWICDNVSVENWPIPP